MLWSASSSSNKKSYTELDSDSFHGSVPTTSSMLSRGANSTGSVFELEDANIFTGGVRNDLSAQNNDQSRRNWLQYLIYNIRSTSRLSLITFSVFIVLLSTFIYVFVTSPSIPPENDNLQYFIQSNPSVIFPDLKINSLAFGSCTAYDLRKMSIWEDAIIPAKPDVFIWAGDMVYLDNSDIDCSIVQSDSSYWQKSCNCSSTWLTSPPHSCRGGDVDYANARWLKALRNIEYNRFLDYMCPRARDLGVIPPQGTDSTICDKPILGIYDDHDFGVNDVNGRLPQKHLFKEMYLDAIGENRRSTRRNVDRGAYFKYRLNGHSHHDGQIDVFLLDGRYERDSIPCDTRRDYCERLVLPDLTGEYAHRRAWCIDFLYDESQPNQLGSCCRLDEAIFWGWCQESPLAVPSHPLYAEACDVTSSLFGMRSLIVDPLTNDLRLPLDSEEAQQSPFCDVLGRQQRKWLKSSITKSKARVKLIVSGSVLMDNPGHHVCGTSQVASTSPLPTTTTAQGLAKKSMIIPRRAVDTTTLGVNISIVDTSQQQQQRKMDEVTCRCSGDNWDCYSVAQRELLHTLSQAKGCLIVLTGDYHFADIKAMRPGVQPYSQVYNSEANAQTIYQIMSSGMSTSTGRNVSCEDFRKDPYQLRTHPECAFVTGPNFGRVQFVYDRRPSRRTKGKLVTYIKEVKLQVMGGTRAEDVRLETIIDTSTCLT